jgi:hypothetical protein
LQKRNGIKWGGGQGKKEQSVNQDDETMGENDELRQKNLTFDANGMELPG